MTARILLACLLLAACAGKPEPVRVPADVPACEWDANRVCVCTTRQYGPEVAADWRCEL